jgi:hypothetical protein
MQVMLMRAKLEPSLFLSLLVMVLSTCFTFQTLCSTPERIDRTVFRKAKPAYCWRCRRFIWEASDVLPQM